MPLELQIIRAAEFIRLGAEGHFDLAASKAALARLAAACRKRGIDRALVDLRELQPGPRPVFSPADLADLVDTFREVGFTRRLRLALLYQSDPHRRARLFSFLSIMRGWNVRALGDFEEALLWLSAGQDQESTAARRRLPGEKLLPVRTRNAQAAPVPVRVSPAGHSERQTVGQKPGGLSAAGGAPGFVPRQRGPARASRLSNARSR